MPESDSARSPHNVAAWMGPLIAVPGFLSYWLFFVQWPLFRDFPWMNLLILSLAIGISLVGVRRARTRRGRIGSVAGLTFSLLLTGLLSYYCFVLSYQVPDAGRAVATGTPLPAVTLVSWDGKPIDLGEAGRDELILVFYRGYW